MDSIPGKKTYNSTKIRLPARPMQLWTDNSQTEDVRIEIIPLIDVIFCILTFFILAAVGYTRQQAINLDLPQAATSTSQIEEMLVVTLDDFGQIYVEQNRVSTKNELYQALNTFQDQNEEGLMVLQASASSSYDEVIQVLDVLREVGGNRVALATLPKAASVPGEAPPAPQTIPTLSPEFAPLPEPENSEQ